MSGIVDDSFWPVLFFVPAMSNIMVFFRGEGVSRYLTSLLIDMGICAFMYVKDVLNLLWSCIFFGGLLVLAYVVEKLFILLKRRYYGEV